MGIHFMSQRLSLLARSFVFVALFLTGHALAAARLEPLTVAYSNFTGTYGPLWLAVEERDGEIRAAHQVRHESGSRREVVTNRRTLSRFAGVGTGRRRRGGDVGFPSLHCAKSRLSGIGQFRQARDRVSLHECGGL